MKNHSKNNFSDKRSNKNKIKSESEDFIKSKKNNAGRKPQKYKSEFNQITYKDKKERKNSSLRRNNKFIDKNKDLSSKFKNNYLETINKKSFDDWIWGKHSVYESLMSERPINRIWCTSEIFSSEKFYLSLKDQKAKGVLIEEVSWNRISQLTFGATHQGIAIQLASSKSISLKKLIDLSKTNVLNPIILALDGITDPHNLGAIIRSAEAFNCKGIVIPQRRSAGLTGTVAKVAAGALEHISISRVVNLNRALEELKSNGFLIVGMTGNCQLSVSEFKEKTPLVVVIGAEDKGISLITQNKCDYLLKIPLKGKTSSLNASVAAAISLFYFTNN